MNTEGIELELSHPFVDGGAKTTIDINSSIPTMDGKCDEFIAKIAEGALNVLTVAINNTNTAQGRVVLRNFNYHNRHCAKDVVHAVANAITICDLRT